jgi:hypothetical protein
VGAAEIAAHRSGIVTSALASFNAISHLSADRDGSDVLRVPATLLSFRSA